MLLPVVAIVVVIAIEGAGVFPVPATKAMDASMASTVDGVDDISSFIIDSNRQSARCHNNWNMRYEN